MLRNTVSGGGMSGQSHQNVAEMIKLLESSNISVIEQTCTLVRDSLSSNSDPLLLNGLIDHYMSTGNTVIRTLLVGVRSPHYKNFLVKLDEYLQKPSTRYVALNLMGHVVRKEPSWLHQIVQSRAFTTVIKCLQLDNDITVLTMAMYVISTLLPKLPTEIAPSLNHLFGILIRLMSWKIIRGVDASELNLCNFETALFSFFLSIYGMYPCNLVECLQNYYGNKKLSDAKSTGTPVIKYATSPGEEQVLMERKRYEIFKVSVAPILRKVCFNPHMIMYSKDLEITSDKWRKKETHDIVTDISYLLIGEEDPVFTNEHVMRTAQTPEENVSEMSSPDACLSDEAVWSPSMFIGLSTPPSSRGMSPTRELLDESKSGNEKSRIKHRPVTLSLSFGITKTSNASTPCTPTLPSQLFDFEKGDSDNDFMLVPAHVGVSSSKDTVMLSPKAAGPLTSPINATEVEISMKCDDTVPNFSPALQPVKGDQTDAYSQGQKTSDTLFIDTDQPTVQNLLKLAWGDAASGKKSDILKSELRLSIQAGRRKSDIDWQHFGQGPLSEKESKSLLSGYLQLQCALAFEKHRRQQHATKARRLMRKIYESSALFKRNETLEELLLEKDNEISKLQSMVKSLRNEKIELETKHRSATEVLKRDLSRNSVLLKAMADENEMLKREKMQDKDRISALAEEQKKSNADLIKANFQLEYETRNKEVNENLRSQVIALQKELLLAEELSRNVEMLQENDRHFRTAKIKEYEMLIRSYKNENSSLENRYLKAARALDAASAKAADLARLLEMKNSNIQEQKKYLENVKSLARSQIQSIQSKYQAQKSIISQMEIQIMELFSKLSAFEGSPDDAHSGRRIQKSVHAMQHHGSTLGISPELSPPVQVPLSGQMNVATLELEASTLTDQN